MTKNRENESIYTFREDVKEDAINELIYYLDDLIEDDDDVKQEFISDPESFSDEAIDSIVYGGGIDLTIVQGVISVYNGDLLDILESYMSLGYITYDIEDYGKIDSVFQILRINLEQYGMGYIQDNIKNWYSDAVDMVLASYKE